MMTMSQLFARFKHDFFAIYSDETKLRTIGQSTEHEDFHPVFTSNPAEAALPGHLKNSLIGLVMAIGADFRHGIMLQLYKRAKKIGEELKGTIEITNEYQIKFLLDKLLESKCGITRALASSYFYKAIKPYWTAVHKKYDGLEHYYTLTTDIPKGDGKREIYESSGALGALSHNDEHGHISAPPDSSNPRPEFLLQALTNSARSTKH